MNGGNRGQGNPMSLIMKLSHTLHHHAGFIYISLHLMGPNSGDMRWWYDNWQKGIWKTNLLEIWAISQSIYLNLWGLQWRNLDISWKMRMREKLCIYSRLYHLRKTLWWWVQILLEILKQCESKGIHRTRMLRSDWYASLIWAFSDSLCNEHTNNPEEIRLV